MTSTLFNRLIYYRSSIINPRWDIDLNPTSSKMEMLWMHPRKCVYASTAERLGAGGMQHMPYARTELAHDVRLSLLRSRSGAAASASASAKRARSGLRGSMEKRLATQKKKKKYR